MSDITSDKSRGVALAMATVLGPFGAHRFYVGKWGTGLLMAGTIGGLGFWYLYDLILVASGVFRDAEGRRVASWAESDPGGSRGGEGSGTAHQELLEEIDVVRAEVLELAERVDFMERLLARSRESAALEPPVNAPAEGARRR